MGPTVGSSSQKPASINQNQLSEPTKASESKSDQMPSSGNCVDDSTQSLGPTSSSSSEKSDPTNQNQLESTKGSKSKSSGNRGGDSKQPFVPAFGSSNGSSSEKSAQMTQSQLSEPTSVSEVKQHSTMLSTRVHIQPSKIPLSIQTRLLNPVEVLSGNAYDNNSVLTQHVTGLPNSAEVLSRKPPDNNSDLASNVTSEPNHLSQPSKLENNEVYESTNDSTLVSGLIQGPCEVLRPSKFEEKIICRFKCGDMDTHSVL
ncbi:hypothetical protein ACFE04_001958 [Oxalis oulophora]